MNGTELVFDFDGWRLNGVAIGEDVARLAFLGEEDPPLRSQPGWLERIANRFTGRKPRYLEDEVLEFVGRGLVVEFEGSTIYGYSFFVRPVEPSGYEPYRGRFLNGGRPLSLSPATTRDDIIGMFGQPSGEEGEAPDPDDPWLTYVQGDWELTFNLADDGRLETIETYWYGEPQ